MAVQPRQPLPKSRGDSISPVDWNDLIAEVRRLDADKVNRSGDTLNGPLSVAGAVGIGMAASVDVPLRLRTSGADDAPLMALHTPGIEDFVSIFGGTRSNQLPFLAWQRGDLRFGTAKGPEGAGFKELLRINGSNSADARLEVHGGVRAAHLLMGPWPASSRRHGFVGVDTIDQTQAGNYALLQDAGPDTGTTYVNSPDAVHLRIDNDDRVIVQNDGTIAVIPPSTLAFGDQTRQMLTLKVPDYGIGVQSGTLYFRTGDHFAWYRGSSHEDGIFHPGAGGRTLMRLDTGGNLFLRGQVFQNVNFNDPPVAPAAPLDPLDPAPLSAVRHLSNVAPLRHALEDLLRLRGVTFTWSDPGLDAGQSGEQVGFLAQEVAEVFPQWVTNAAGGHPQLAVSGFEALAVEALRTLTTQNDTLRADVDALVIRVAALEARWDNTHGPT